MSAWNSNVDRDRLEGDQQLSNADIIDKSENKYSITDKDQNATDTIVQYKSQEGIR